MAVFVKVLSSQLGKACMQRVYCQPPLDVVYRVFELYHLEYFSQMVIAHGGPFACPIGPEPTWKLDVMPAGCGG